jgi:hypothetical protein
LPSPAKAPLGIDVIWLYESSLFIHNRDHDHRVKKTFINLSSVKVWTITSGHACESSARTVGEAGWARYIPTITIHNQ